MIYVGVVQYLRIRDEHATHKVLLVALVVEDLRNTVGEEYGNIDYQ